MKKIVYGLILAISMSTSATAFAAWCRAESPSAWGEGVAYTVDQACQIAMMNCAAMTPQWQTCYVVNYAY